MLHLLLIEDNPSDILLFREGLRHCSIPADVFIAHDGSQAARMLEELKFRPDFIILDLNLPQSSGLEFLERYRDSLGSPVIVYTSSHNPCDREEAFRLGAAEYVIKPVGFQETIDMVCQLMERLTNKGASQGASTRSMEHSRTPTIYEDRHTLGHRGRSYRRFEHRRAHQRNQQPSCPGFPPIGLQK